MAPGSFSLALSLVWLTLCQSTLHLVVGTMYFLGGCFWCMWLHQRGMLRPGSSDPWVWFLLLADGLLASLMACVEFRGRKPVQSKSNRLMLRAQGSVESRPRYLCFCCLMGALWFWFALLRWTTFIYLFVHLNVYYLSIHLLFLLPPVFSVQKLSCMCSGSDRLVCQRNCLVMPWLRGELGPLLYSWVKYVLLFLPKWVVASCELVKCDETSYYSLITHFIDFK